MPSKLRLVLSFLLFNFCVLVLLPATSLAQDSGGEEEVPSNFDILLDNTEDAADVVGDNASSFTGILSGDTSATSVLSAGGGLANIFSDDGSVLGGVGEGVSDGVGSFVENTGLDGVATDGLTGTFGAVSDIAGGNISLDSAGNLVDAVGDLGGENGFLSNFSGIGEGLGLTGEDGFFSSFDPSGIFGNLGGVGESFGEAFSGVGDMVGNLSGIAEGIGDIAGAIGTGIGAITGAIGGFLGNTFGGAGRLLSGLIGRFQQIGDSIRNAFSRRGIDISVRMRGVGGGRPRGRRARRRGGAGDLPLPENSPTRRGNRNADMGAGPRMAGVGSTVLSTMENRAMGHDLKQAYDGWSAMNNVVPSSIVFDPISQSAMLDRYPEISFSNYHREGRRLSLKSINLSTDLEVRKLSMAVFAPLYDIEASYVNDESLRERYLNLFQSVRGIALLTLSYLDKTVGAGLATVHDQAKNNATNHLLKNIGLATAKLANPEMSSVFTDHDEKVTFCMQSLRWREWDSQYPETKLPPYINLGFLSRNGLEGCQGEGAAPYTCGTPTNVNAYDYCQCCASLSMDMNGTGLSEDNIGRRFYSAVERAFWGRNKPAENQLTDGSQPEIYKLVSSMVDTVKAFYGDYLTFQNALQIDTAFVPPRDSVSAIVTKFKEGCIFPEDTTRESSSAFVCNDGYQTYKFIKYGICPSMRRILATWGPEGGRGRQDLEPYFSEASLGGINLTARDIKNALALDNITRLPIASTAQEAANWAPDENGKLHRWLEAYCDAASVAAVRRVHHVHRAAIADHFRMNRLSSDENKMRVMRLVNRMTEQLDLAVADANSTFDVQQTLLASSMQEDRRSVAVIGSTVEGFQNSNRNRSMIRGGGAYGMGSPVSGTTRTNNRR